MDHFSDYLTAVDAHNIHPEIGEFPAEIRDFQHLIVYGPSGVGKYTQTLRIVRQYSPSSLKYEKKMTVVSSTSDKLNYTYKISDIHYEIDMALLGCNSKLIFHEVFTQLIEIISLKPNRIGILLCKNFHNIHAELLDIFYSYIQQFHINIQLKFILLTEHLSFIPANIAGCCNILAVPRPSKQDLLRTQHSAAANIDAILAHVPSEHLMNLKEIGLFATITPSEIPKDIFNIVCNNVINEIANYRTMSIGVFRDAIYDILIYNLDVPECIWYIFSHFICAFSEPMVADLLLELFTFFKYYNNNYRAIFHFERLFMYMILQLRAADDTAVPISKEMVTTPLRGSGVPIHGSGVLIHGSGVPIHGSGVLDTTSDAAIV